MQNLPDGVRIFRNKKTARVEALDDITGNPGRRGFGPVDADSEFGADIRLVLYSTEAEANAFKHGFKVACPGDDCVFAGERLLVKRSSVYAVWLLFGDSSETRLIVDDRRPGM